MVMTLSRSDGMIGCRMETSLFQTKLKPWNDKENLLNL